MLQPLNIVCDHRGGAEYHCEACCPSAGCDMHSMTGKQRDVLRHALGADSPSPGYRNHYVIGPDCADWDLLQSCVRDGLMVERPYGGAPGMSIFRVTELGQELVAVRYQP